MIKFSVIIPNFNHADFLKERIESVLSQAHPPSEVIILDDCSTDNSIQVIEEYRDHPLVSHIIHNEQNSGSPFLQWRKGIQSAAGDWVWIAESDDVADSSFLETANHILQQNPGTGIFYCDSVCRSENNTTPWYKTFAEMKNKFFKTSKWSSDHSNKGEDEINQHLKFFCTINNTSAAIFRKDLLLNIVNQLDSFIYHGDWYCQLAVGTHTNIAYSAKAMNTFRIHDKNFLRHSKGTQSKLECFRILDFLYKHEFVTSKKQLLDFFTLQYLGFGLMKDGFRYGRTLFISYSAINKTLSRKVFRSLIWQKVTGKRHKVIF